MSAGATVDNHIAAKVMPFKIEADSSTISVDYPMGSGFKTWSEFLPALYELKIELAAKAGQTNFQHSKKTTFAMRQLESTDASFVLNGRRIFLRGTVECCVFPLTGYPAMDAVYWEKIFKTCRSYGLNHVRFHSWCPPEQAFAVADSMGFYLQVELPIWVHNFGTDKPREAFRQIRGRQDNLGLWQPSFILPAFSRQRIGRRFRPDTGTGHVFKKPRSSPSVYNYLVFLSERLWQVACAADEFYVAQQTLKGWIRGQGFFNGNVPSTTLNFNSSLEGVNIPTIAHEIGQYAVYPKMSEIQKYTGVLRPVNFEAIKNDLASKHLLGHSDEFTLASGKLAELLYKEDIELGLRSSSLDGFQLLSLTDFPGQGTALTGILDVFWESKGIMLPREFRRFCSPTVPLLQMPKMTYLKNETFAAMPEIAHFGQASLEDVRIIWTATDDHGRVAAKGKFKQHTIKTGGNTELAPIKFSLNSINEASMLRLVVKIEDTDISNYWDIWVYPAKEQIKTSDDLLITKVLDANAHAHLAAGKKVLLTATRDSIRNPVSGRFVPVFWSPVHFANQAGTMGILCDPNHAALARFPTDFHTNWQWWELTAESTAININSLPCELKPVIQVIDNFLRNNKLAYAFEARVGKGKLLVCTLDIDTDLDKRIVARQLRRSLVSYASSEKFNPAIEVSTEMLDQLFSTRRP